MGRERCTFYVHSGTNGARFAHGVITADAVDGAVETFNAYMSHEVVQKSGLSEEVVLIEGVMRDRRSG